MPLTALESELRTRIRAQIEQGELPSEVPTTIWGGNGSGEKCSACDKPIERNEVEFEYSIGAASIRFHRLCHGLWQIECERAVALQRKNARLG